MDNKLSELSYSIYSNKGVFVLLLGSGVSRPAGIPTGWEIVIDLIKQIAVLEKQKVVENHDDWFKKHFGEEPDYSNILEKLTSTPEERVNALRKYFEPGGEEANTNLKKPTVAHKMIAQLVQRGFIKVIITTNFDRLTENALKDLGIEPTVISNPSQIENTMPLIHSGITVIKIHGDYLDTRFLNIKSELNEYDPRLQDLLTFVLENFGVITCGWSAKWDGALVNSFKVSNKFRFGNYFLHTGNPTEELESLSKYRRGSLVRIKDADSLFKELAENVEALEKFNGENPLSAKIVLARTKKYLAKEEHLIALSDLIRSSTDDICKRLNDIAFPHPTNESVMSTINAHISITEEIIPILVEGGYWSKSYQQVVWTNAIKRIGNPKETSSSYDIWTQTSLIPLILVRYAFGLASLAAENWDALKSSLEIKFRTKYDREHQGIIKKTHVWRLMDATNLKAVLRHNYHTPMSELLFNTLRKHFLHILADDEDFAETFDYYEFICCLMFLKDPRNLNEYPPTGRFSWRNQRRLVVKKGAEFNGQGENFELVKTGLLTKDEMKAAIGKLDEILKNERYI